MDTFAVGDLQGCYSSLIDLLNQIKATSNHAKYIFVGDLINRGPDSLRTLRAIQALGDQAKVLLGNHDLHLLAVAYGIRKSHPSDTIQEILDAPDRETLLDWLRHQPLALLESSHLLVHAGVLPQWDLHTTLALAREFEAVIQGPNWLEFLTQMYGNTPAQWSDDLQGNDRLRCIVNAMTRIRFCTPEGKMDLSNKYDLDKAPPGYLPWFEVPDRRTSGVPIVFGHWSTLGLIVQTDLVAIDTGCLWGGKLTAVRLDDHAIFQVECPQYCKPF